MMLLKDKTRNAFERKDKINIDSTNIIIIKIKFLT